MDESGNLLWVKQFREKEGTTSDDTMRGENKTADTMRVNVGLCVQNMPTILLLSICSLDLWDIDSCHSRCIGINKIYILNPTAVVELLQYSGFRVEHRDGFSSHK